MSTKPKTFIAIIEIYRGIPIWSQRAGHLIRYTVQGAGGSWGNIELLKTAIDTNAELLECAQILK